MRRYIILLTAALSLGACAQDNGASSVDYGARQRLLDQRCSGAADVHACETHAIKEAQAAIFECRMQGQMAASNASMSGGIVGGAIYGAATGNQIYTTCLHMKAAQLGY